MKWTKTQIQFKKDAKVFILISIEQEIVFLQKMQTNMAAAVSCVEFSILKCLFLLSMSAHTVANLSPMNFVLVLILRFTKFHHFSPRFSTLNPGYALKFVGILKAFRRNFDGFLLRWLK